MQNATQVGENTAQRVGGVLVDIVDKMGVFDTVPTSGSTNPVTSGGIRAAMDEQAENLNANLNANTGVSEYPAFSASTTYAIGDVVNYNGKLYRFTANHKAGAWTGSDVEPWSLKEQAENLGIRTVQLSDLDTLGVDGDNDKIASFLGANGSHYAVMSLGRLCGVLKLFTDGMGHVVTQVFTTHMIASSSGFSGSHQDDKIFTYYRSYGVSKGSSSVPVGSWTKWEEIFNSTLKNNFDAMRSSLNAIDIRSVLFTNSLINVAEYDFSKYTDVINSDNTITINGMEFVQLAYKTSATSRTMRIYGWGDFILRNDTLLNFSTGNRKLLFLRTGVETSAYSNWHNFDKIVITRTSSEPISIDTNITGLSTKFTLTTDGYTDTIEAKTDKTKVLPDGQFSTRLVLNIPRSCYISKISIIFRSHVVVYYYDKDGLIASYNHPLGNLAATTDINWDALDDKPSILEDIAFYQKSVLALSLIGNTLVMSYLGEKDGKYGLYSNQYTFKTINGRQIVKSGSESENINLPTVEEVEELKGAITKENKTNMLEYVFSEYITVTQMSYTHNFDGNIGNQLSLKSIGGDSISTYLWAWGDFIITQNQLKNQSTGNRLLAVSRTTTETYTALQKGDIIEFDTDSDIQPWLSSSGMEKEGNKFTVVADNIMAMFLVQRNTYFKKITIRTVTGNYLLRLKAESGEIITLSVDNNVVSAITD